MMKPHPIPIATPEPVTLITVIDHLTITKNQEKDQYQVIHAKEIFDKINGYPITANVHKR